MKDAVPIVPFNGDHHIGVKIFGLVFSFDIKTIVETGTWSGHTTRLFATMGPKVVTIDSTWKHLTEEFGVQGLRDMDLMNISMVLGDSSKDLSRIIDSIEHPALFYLDAHGGGDNGSNVNPLLEELEQLEGRNDCVIVIHDFFVPGQIWGYNGGDWGRGFEPLSYELIKPYLEKIYPSGYEYAYNTVAEGAQRGVIYVYPKG